MILTNLPLDLDLTLTLLLMETTQMRKMQIPTLMVDPTGLFWLRVDFGDDGRSIATAKSVVTSRTERTLGTTTTAKTKKHKDVLLPPILLFTVG